MRVSTCNYISSDKCRFMTQIGLTCRHLETPSNSNERCKGKSQSENRVLSGNANVKNFVELEFGYRLNSTLEFPTSGTGDWSRKLIHCSTIWILCIMDRRSFKCPERRDGSSIRHCKNANENYVRDCFPMESCCCCDKVGEGLRLRWSKMFQASNSAWRRLLILWSIELGWLSWLHTVTSLLRAKAHSLKLEKNWKWLMMHMEVRL